MRRLRPLLFVFVLAATTTMMIKADSEAGRVYADDLETHESRYKVRAKPEPYKPSKPAPSFDELSHFGEKRTASADAQDSRKAAVEDDYLRKKAKYNSAKRRRKLRKRKRKKNRPVVTTPSPLITTRGYLEVTPKSQPRPRPRHGKKKNKNNENRKTPFTAFTAAEYEDESVDQAGSFKSARAVPYHPSTPYDYSPTPSPTYGQPPSPHPSYQPPTPAAPAYSPSPAPYTPTTAYHSPSPSPYSPTPKPAYASPTPAPYTTSYSPGYQSPTPAYHPTTPKPPPPPPPPQPAYKRPPPPPPPPPAPAPVPYKAPQLPSLKYHPDPHPHDLDDDEYYEFEVSQSMSHFDMNARKKDLFCINLFRRCDFRSLWRIHWNAAAKVFIIRLPVYCPGCWKMKWLHLHHCVAHHISLPQLFSSLNRPFRVPTDLLRLKVLSYTRSIKKNFRCKLFLSQFCGF